MGMIQEECALVYIHRSKTKGQAMKEITNWMIPQDAMDGIIEITPELATMMLTANLGNRRIRRSGVAYLKSVIENGEWQPDLDAISFSTIRLVNGQHRLVAIAESGITVQAWVRYGVRDELFEHFDQIIPRTLDDRIKFVEGRQDHNKFVGQLVTFRYYLDYINKPGSKGIRKATPEMARRCFDQHANAFEWAAATRRKFRGLGTQPVWTALCEFYEKHPKDAVEFTESFNQPMGSSQQPAMLRDWLLRTRHGGGYGQKMEIYEKTIYCCNAYIEGKEIVQVRRDSRGIQ